MCRLFAQASPSPQTARDLLVDSEYSLLRQADLDPANPQVDGWGVAWFDEGGRARVTKSGKPAPEEKARFAETADAAKSSIVLGHIRAASKGIGIDDARAHPFADEGWVFAHNGTLIIWKEVAAELGDRRGRLKTESDSEVYFQQFLKHLAATRDASKAFEACVAENWRLWETCKGKYMGINAPYTSLNAIASDGKAIHALCHAASKGLANFGVCHKDQPWSVMSFAQRGGKFVLASEGVDGGEWTRLTPPETISAVPGRAPERRRLDLAAVVGHPVTEVSRS